MSADSARAFATPKDLERCLIEEGRMQPAGMIHVEAARADGRWEQAYAGSAEMDLPDDFLRALDGRPVAKKFFATLKRAHLLQPPDREAPRDTRAPPRGDTREACERLPGGDAVRRECVDQRAVDSASEARSARREERGDERLGTLLGDEMTGVLEAHDLCSDGARPPRPYGYAATASSVASP